MATRTAGTLREVKPGRTAYGSATVTCGRSDGPTTSTNGSPTIASTLSLLRMCTKPQYILANRTLETRPEAASIQMSMSHTHEILRGPPWGGGCEPIWYERDPRVRNVRVCVAFPNVPLVDWVLSKMTEFARLKPELSPQEAEDLTNPWGREVARTRPREIEDVSRFITSCRARAADWARPCLLWDVARSADWATGRVWRRDAAQGTASADRLRLAGRRVRSPRDDRGVERRGLALHPGGRAFLIGRSRRKAAGRRGSARHGLGEPVRCRFAECQDPRSKTTSSSAFLGFASSNRRLTASSDSTRSRSARRRHKAPLVIVVANNGRGKSRLMIRRRCMARSSARG